MAIARLLLKILGQLLKWLVIGLEKLFLGIEITTKWIAKIVSKLNWKSLVLGLIGFIFSCWTVYTYNYPKIDIDFTDPLDSSDITTSIFTLKNQGEVNIYNVASVFYIKTLKWGSCNIENMNMYVAPVYKKIPSNRDQTILANLLKNKAWDFECSPNSKTIEAELHIFVKYNYWFKKFTNHDTLRFKSSEMVNNKIVWTKIQ